MEAPIRFQKVDHYFGDAGTRKQVLHSVDLSIDRGEIVIVTGPSGSGKTTALTLAGALRAAQEGSLRVLGEELRGASRARLVSVRRQIGYIFQLHNLLDSLTARGNVEMALGFEPSLSRKEIRSRATEMLEAVGLGDRIESYASELSGGQKQRVAIARALVSKPQIVLADEPTASLDKASGRGVVTQIQELARKQGTTVVMVTHDNRVLDVADRIVHLEDGCVTSFGEAVMQNTQQMMGLLAESNRRGGLAREVEGLGPEEFTTVLASLTAEAQEFLRVTELASNEAFGSMLDQLIDLCTQKVGELLEADRTTLFLLDAEREELWSKVALDSGGVPFEIRIPCDEGIAGAVATSGEVINLENAYTDPRFHADVDRDSNYVTRSLLCIPIHDRSGEIFGVAQLLNKRGDRPFDAADIERFRGFIDSVGVLLESWWRMSGSGDAGAGAG